MPTIISIGAVSARAFGFGAKAGAVTGQQAYTTAGTYSWVAPAGVTKVSVVAVGAGGKGGLSVCCTQGGFGGGLGYKNNITVVPGNSYTVVVGLSCFSNLSVGNSYFNNASVVKGGAGVSYFTYGACGSGYVGDGGGYGGIGGRSCVALKVGGGGAGGYGSVCFQSGGCGYPRGSRQGKLGGGGGGGYCFYRGGGGGGVGILGQGANGVAGAISAPQYQGGGGSGGVGGGCSVDGGSYGGGGGSASSGVPMGLGANGAVRIIWPGTTRQFPSTCTGDK